MEQLGINVTGLLGQAVNFLLLLALLRLVAYKPIIRMLDERSARIKESMERAENIQRQAARTEEEFALRLTEARREAQSIIGQANQIAERVRADEVEKTRQLLEDMRTRALSDIERERERAVTDVRKQASELVLMATTKVLGRTLDSATHQQLIDNALAEVQNINSN